MEQVISFGNIVTVLQDTKLLLVLLAFLKVDLWEQLERRFSGIGEALGISGQAERRQRLSQYFANQSLKPVGDHAPRCYATKIWNAI